MIEPESQIDNSAFPRKNKFIERLAKSKFLFLITFLLVVIAVMPLSGILFPPLADLPEQLLTSKLLWEKLAGVSQLDLEVSWFLSYRLFAALMVLLITVFKLSGISLIYLPSTVAMSLVAIHAVIIGTSHYFALQNKSWQSFAVASCLALPAVAALYSACYFIGFIGFTLGIILLVPAIFLTEQFLRSGTPLNAFFVFLILFLVYTAHPFALAFWLMWCASRTLATFLTGSFAAEWKKLFFLGVLFSPLVLYHLLATSQTEMALSKSTSSSNIPFDSLSHWYEYRLGGLLNGVLLKADDLSNSYLFAPAALGMIIFAALFALLATRNQRAKNLMLACLFFIFISSAVNEKFIPTPGVHWLAYDYRFVSTVLVICLAVSGLILIRFLPVAATKIQYKLLYAVLIIFSIVASVQHLFEVQAAYTRFDMQARLYMGKVFAYEDPKQIYLPRSQWHPNGAFINHYICLKQPDCNPPNTSFRNYGGDLYPVKLKSYNPEMDKIYVRKPTEDENAPPANAFRSVLGKGRGQFDKPRGVAVDAATGNFYVADAGNSRVQKFSPDGSFLLAIGTRGGREAATGDGELESPHGVAVDAAGDIYVTDEQRNRLLKFRADGTFIKERTGPAPGFFVPRDLAIASNKQLYILDPTYSRVVRFDLEREIFGEWKTAPEQQGLIDFSNATGIAAAGDYIFITEAKNDRLHVFDVNGKLIKQWNVPQWDKYIWHYPDVVMDEKTKLIYLTSGWSSEVLVFDMEGNYVKSIKPIPPAAFNNISSIALAETKDGKRLFVLDTGSDVVEKGEPSVSVFELENKTDE